MEKIVQAIISLLQSIIGGLTASHNKKTGEATQAPSETPYGMTLSNLVHDLAWVEVAVHKYVKVPLNQNQYDALCSFVYNLGATNFKNSTLLKKLNKKDYNGAANELPRWNKQKGKVLRGLTIRRQLEKDLFLS